MPEEPFNHRGRTGTDHWNPWMRRASIQSDGYFCTGDSGESFTAMCNMPDLYLVEGLNQIRRRGEEFAVKKKTFTTKDTRRRGSF